MVYITLLEQFQSFMQFNIFQHFFILILWQQLFDFIERTQFLFLTKTSPMVNSIRNHFLIFLKNNGKYNFI